MKEQLANAVTVDKLKLSPLRLKTFFITHLNKVYCAKKYLAEQLSDIRAKAHFLDLKAAIDETQEDIEKQIARLKEVYVLMDTKVSSDNCNGIKGIVKDALRGIDDYTHDAEMRDLSILFFMQIIESVEMASFQMLQLAAVKLKDKQINQLLRENYDEAKADRTLLLLIAARYVIR